jgi:restriction system protein
MNAAQKKSILLELAAKRRRTSWPGYFSIGKYHDGVYECDYVSPYTKSANNVDAEVMILLQDWSSDAAPSSNLDPAARDLGHTPSLPTNRNLKRLLSNHLGLELQEVYATNLFPFIKERRMSSRVPFPDFVRAAREFAIPQIQVVSPKILICLGLNTFNAVRVASGAAPKKPMATAIISPMQLGSTPIRCQANTGARGQSNRGREQVEMDWSKMKAVLEFNV